MIDSVVVGVDGSDEATRAAKWAAKTAELYGTTLFVVATYDIDPLSYAQPMVIPQDVVDAVRTEATEFVTAAGAAAREVSSSVTIKEAVLEGAATRVLVDQSKEARLVVLGTRGLGAISGLFRGSVSTHVAAHAHCPVVVVAGEAGDGPVVVGVDSSDASASALRTAVTEAQLRGTSVSAVSAWTGYTRDMMYGYGLEQQDYDILEQHAAQDLSEQIADVAGDAPVTIDQSVVSGLASEAVVEAAASPQLIVVGSRGRGGFTGMLLGSTSQEVLHHTKFPVMIVHEHDHKSRTSGA